MSKLDWMKSVLSNWHCCIVEYCLTILLMLVALWNRCFTELRKILTYVNLLDYFE